MMDFGGALDLSGLVGPENRAASHPVSDQDPTTKPKTNGSGFLKKGRSGSGEEDWWISKTARTDDDSVALLLRSNQPNMISFSSTKSEVPFLSKSGGGFTESSRQNSGFTYSTRNTGYGSGSLNGGMNAPLVGARAPFTPSQWVELEHQALIYKYILANVPVPSNLLIPLKNFFTQYGLSGLSSGSYAPNSLGWGSFHLGFTGNTDPEPGRCRRTDGKKWRCSKDAVPDQKYCERHLNRNRHRSRKPVEGQNGQAVSGTAKKVAPISCSSSASVMPSGGASNSCDITQRQFKCLQPGAEKPSTDVRANRMQDPEGLSMVSPTTNWKSKDYPFSIPKQHIPIEESSGFGLVSSDSLMNPSQKSSYVNSTTYNSILDFNDPKSSDTQHSLRHFVDDWPEDQANHATVAWPEELKSDWTQLSMSIPMASSDFSSTSSSSPQEKIAHSPLSLSHEFDPIQMGLTVNNNLNQLTEKQTNWIPISWGSSMGGPLGEVLNSSSSTLEGWKKSALNLTTGIWNGSPQLHGSSPNGVLNKATFVSLSNSSSGNSTPRADENLKTNGAGSLGGDMVVSTLGSPFSTPNL